MAEGVRSGLRPDSAGRMPARIVSTIAISRRWMETTVRRWAGGEIVELVQEHTLAVCGAEIELDELPGERAQFRLGRAATRGDRFGGVEQGLHMGMHHVEQDVFFRRVSSDR